MTAYDLAAASEQWSSPPVDEVGYLSSEMMLDWSDDDLVRTIDQMSEHRYDGWRNRGGKWRDSLGLDSTTGQTVFDFGCGVGLEAIQFARTDNRVLLFDISPTNQRLAARVVELYTGTRAEIIPANEQGLWDYTQFDVFYANGSLHHTPDATRVLEHAVDCLTPGGEVRLMVYTDQAWREATDRDPAHLFAHDENPALFLQYVRAMDRVGHYADWYTPEKMRDLWGGFLTVESFTPLGTGTYAAAVLTAR